MLCYQVGADLRRLGVFNDRTLSSTLVEGMVGVGTTGGAPPVVVVGDDGENIVGLIFACRLIGVALPNINGTVWFPSWMVLSSIDCCCCCMVSLMTAMSLISNVI